MGLTDMEDGLARVYMNLGVVLIDCEYYDEALDYLNKSIRIRKKYLGSKKHPGRLAGLAGGYLNYAVCTKEAGDLKQSGEYTRKAINILTYLVEERGLTDYRPDYARALANHANTLKALSKNRDAEEYYLKAMAIQEELVENRGRNELVFNLMMTYVNHSENCIILRDDESTLNLVEKTVNFIRDCSNLISPDNKRKIEAMHKKLSDFISQKKKEI